VCDRKGHALSRAKAAYQHRSCAPAVAEELSQSPIYMVCAIAQTVKDKSKLPLGMF